MSTPATTVPDLVIRPATPDDRPAIDRLEDDTVVFSDGTTGRFEAVILATGYKPVLVGIFNAQDEGTVLLPCVQPIEERRSRVADVEVAGGTGGEADTHGWQVGASGASGASGAARGAAGALHGYGT